MKEKLKFVFYGIVMGGANVIPGVSGGTMAIVLNFYDRLMESITFNFKVLKKNLDFLIPLGIGLGIGIIGFAKIINYFLEAFPTQTYLSFVGIILGSLPLIWAKARLKDKKVSKTAWIVFVIMLGIMIVMTFMNASEEDAMIKYTSLNLESFIACVIAMAIGSSTMIIPGISGSLMLLIIGMYGTIYGHVIANFDIPMLIPSGIGALIGFVGGAKLMTIFLKRYEQVTYMAILGLLVGSMVELVKRSAFWTGGMVVIASSLVAGAIMFIIVCKFSLAEIKRDQKGE